MTDDVTGYGGAQRRLIGGCVVLVALAAAAFAALAVRPSAAAADASKPWTRTIELRLSPHELGLRASASPRRLARAALQRSARRLGLPRSLAGVRLAQDHRTPAGPAGASVLHGLRFQQTFSGRRVLWSQLDVVVSDREVGLIRATVVPVKRGRPARRATLGRRRALAIARRAAPGREPAGAPQLIVYAGTPARGRAPRLAYVVETAGAATQGEDDPSGLCVVVDARTGRVLTTWRGSAARTSRRRAARPAAARAASMRQVGVTPGVRSAPIIRLNDKLAPGPQTEGGPYGFWRSVLPQNVLANWQTSPTLNTSHVFNADLDAAIRNTKDVVVHMCVTRGFCSRDGTGDARKPFQLTGNDTVSQEGGAFYSHGLERTFLNPFRGYQNDVIAHELGHLIHHVRSRDLLFDTTEQKRSERGSRTCSPTTSTARTHNSARMGPTGRGPRSPIAAGTPPRTASHRGWPTTSAPR